MHLERKASGEPQAREVETGIDKERAKGWQVCGARLHSIQTVGKFYPLILRP